MRNRWYSVGIEAAAQPLCDEQFDQMIQAAKRLRWFHGPAFSFGGDPPSVGVQVSVNASDAGAAAAAAIDGFETVLAEGRVTHGDPEWVAVMTEERFERWLNAPAPELLGLTEVADLLGISRQKLGQLRRTEGFPSPLAELRAGPVWNRAMMQRFVDQRPRRPGGPRKAS